MFKLIGPRLKKIFLPGGWPHFCLLCFCCLALFACGPAKPPIELAPDGAVVKRAIVFQLDQTQAGLSQQFQAPAPSFEVSKINVQSIEAIAINNLPAYHLQGGYDLKLRLPRQTVNQKQNPFDLYLQRQSEGKSWRLLKREFDGRTDREQWRSYLVELEPPNQEI